MEKVRINKYLRNCGIASRRKVEELILDGKVSINGDVIKELGTLVDDADTVLVNGQKVSMNETLFYYMLNKPKGYLCTHKSHNNEPTIYNLFPKSIPLFSIGRLDKDTTGLLIVTNDGDFSNLVIHPSSDVTKEYVATTIEEVTSSHLKQIIDGAIVEMTHVRPYLVKKLSPRTIKIVVKEGKKREVRILVSNAGLTLDTLTRTKIGNLTLDSLPEGHFRPLTAVERQLIFSK